ncbi:hypothetical protein [Paenibacillus sp. FSL R7-0331]|uniref:hypothetical protein n=1 Tax=Paenibacillus sp. FSL R7-0331 TaxID=1536773 RepID=UPI0004F75C22|nr:hypothetical protein [Paenibacillus sp. FSL R7-0331]AIQ54771.1 hypothetical protein R70331_26905 [Paenibacillus sp. FSL R7-0331]
MNEIQTDFLTEQGKITYLGLLDLRHLRSVDELRNVTEISYVGTILISDQLEGSIHNIPMHYVGSVVSIPSDMKVKVLSGDLKLHGDFLENEGGDPEETLLVTGGLIITSPFQKVGYKSLILTGEIFAPKECEYVLTSSISQLYGELHCYESEPRMFSGQDRFGHDFFFYLKKPVTLILRGEFSIEADVSPELLHEKVSEVFLWGNVQTADSKQASLLLALTALKYGDIRAVQT